MIKTFFALKTTLLMLILVLLVSATACSASEDVTRAPGQSIPGSPAGSPVKSQTVPDVAGIIAKQTEAMKGVRSCQSIVHLEMDFKSSDASTGNILIIADMRSDIDTSKRLLKSTVTTNLSVSGTNEKMTQQIIAAGDSVYFKDGEQGQWQKKILEGADLDALWNQQDDQLTGSKYSAAIAPESLIYAGTTKVDNRQCYTLKQPIDAGQILAMAPELLEQLQNTGDIMPEDLSSMLQDPQIVYHVDQANYYLLEVQITARVNHEKEGKKITGKVQESYRFTSFNQPVSVQIPEIK